MKLRLKKRRCSFCGRGKRGVKLGTRHEGCVGMWMKSREREALLRARDAARLAWEAERLDRDAEMLTQCILDALSREDDAPELQVVQ